MNNDISKELKKKTDAMLRLQSQTQKAVVIENTDGSYYAPERADYTASLAAGDNIEILVSGNIKTIKAKIPQSTEIKLGGIKAKARTTETSEVAIDTLTGRLYATALSGGSGAFDYGSITSAVDMNLDYGGLL